MEKINERIYEANIELVDRNKLLEEDLKKAQKRIDTAIAMIEKLMDNNLEVHKGEPIIKVLKGEEYGNNWEDSSD